MNRKGVVGVICTCICSIVIGIVELAVLLLLPLELKA